MTVKEYRSSPEDSYSSFKDFLEDRKKYYRKYILKEKIAEREDVATLMGDLADTITLTPDEFESRFYLTNSKAPTGLMLEFTEALYKRTMENPEESLEDRMQGAYNDVKYDREGNVVAFKRQTYEATVVKFEKECSDYYDEILAVRPNGLTVITANDLQNAEKIRDELYSNPYTYRIMKAVTDDEQTIENQVPIFCTINDYPVKGLIDKREINHVEKYIQPWDLKVTWNVDEFHEKYYLYRRSDIQAAIYYLGCLEFRDKNYPDYDVRPMKFIVADSINYMSPLVYETTEENIADTMSGFTYKNKKYTGLNEVIEDLKWHKENGIWHISRTNYTNNGVVKIKR